MFYHYGFLHSSAFRGLYQKKLIPCLIIKDFDYLCNGIRKNMRFSKTFGYELAFAIFSCLRNVENFNRQVAQATQKKDEVSARAIAWADLILCCRQFPRPRRG